MFRRLFRRKDKLEEKFIELQETMEENTEQVKKLTRMQYKTGQQFTKEQTRLEQKINDLRATANKRETGHCHHVQAVVPEIVQWLDDIDRVRAGLGKGEQDNWDRLLLYWANRLKKMLDYFGFYELEVRGKPFDPAVAKSVKTIGRAELELLKNNFDRDPVNYEVLEVIKRGYVDGNGRLFRKAEVITLAEEDENEKNI